MLLNQLRYVQPENLNITISQGRYSNVANHYNNIVTALYEIVYNIVTLLLQIIAMIKQPPKNIHIQKQLIVTYKQSTTENIFLF